MTSNVSTTLPKGVSSSQIHDSIKREKHKVSILLRWRETMVINKIVPGKAASAASTALSTSFLLALWTFVRSLPFTGEMRSKVVPSELSTNYHNGKDVL